MRKLYDRVEEKGALKVSWNIWIKALGAIRLCDIISSTFDGLIIMDV